MPKWLQNDPEVDVHIEDFVIFSEKAKTNEIQRFPIEFDGRGLNIY